MCHFGVIVDGYSTGAGLAAEFLEHDIACLHVQSQPSIPKVYAHTYVPNDYHAHYDFSGDLRSLAKKLKTYKPKFVIPGAECGIELADHLCEAIGLPGNGSKLSTSRRNKYLMLQHAKAKGIQVIPSFLARTLEDLKDWAARQKVWPLVVKPLNSAGGEGVRVCVSMEEVVLAYTEIMSKKINMLGFKNEGVLIQHYILGEEYVVNLVSYAGDHKLCELWNYTRYRRPQGRQIYDTAKVVNFDMEAHQDVVNYAINTIDALGIQYGPSHVEVMKNEQGCYLIEVGARLMGANLPFSLLGKCISTPQAFYTVMAYAYPEQFKEKSYIPYYIIQPLIAVFMISNQEGLIRAIHDLDKIRALASFYDMKLAVSVGGFLKETIDYQTSPGMIYLSHQDADIIQADLAAIRALEKGMFTIGSL